MLRRCFLTRPFSVPWPCFMLAPCRLWCGCEVSCRSLDAWSLSLQAWCTCLGQPSVLLVCPERRHSLALVQAALLLH